MRFFGEYLSTLLFGRFRSLSFYGRTDPGRVRSHNEDSFCSLANRGLFVVADGMGGHNAGEVASSLAIEALVEFLSEELLASVRGKPEESRLALLAAFDYANKQVMENAAEHPERRGMGATLVACLIDGFDLHLAHVGDARCYLGQSGRFRQLTTDHSGLAYRSSATGDDKTAAALRPVVTQVIGFPFPDGPEYHLERLRPGNRLLLCSDGLWNMLDPTRIEHLLLGAKGPEEAVEALVDGANDEGGRDNITALAIFC